MASSFKALAPPESKRTFFVRFILIPALMAMLLSTQETSEAVSTMTVEGVPLIEFSASAFFLAAFASDIVPAGVGDVLVVSAGDES